MFLDWDRKQLSTQDAKELAQKVKTDTFYKQVYEEYTLSKQLAIAYQLKHIKNQLNTFDYGVREMAWYQKPIYWLGALAFLATNAILFSIVESTNKEIQIQTKTRIVEEIKVEKQPSIPPIVEKKEIVLEKTNPTIPIQLQQAEKVVEEIPQKELVKSVIVLKENKKDSIIVKNSPIIPEKKVVLPIVCDIKMTVKTVETCQNEQNGQLIISLKNAKEPYKIWVNGEEKRGTIIDDLSADLYKISIKDAQNCEIKKEVQVTEKMCLNDKFIIQPSQQIYWS